MNQADERFKFRIWDTTRDCFYPNEHGELDWSLEETIRAESDKDFISELMIIEQCTGLRDENGNLIFEGDKILFIEQLPGGFNLSHEIPVVWNQQRALFEPFDKIRPEFVKIIGNIHRGGIK